nr:ATP synthase F0 subunit 8 [Pseudolimnophila brunneinota]
MPQMAPLKWLSLFIIFSITLIMFNVLNYFSVIPNLKKNKSNMTFINNKSMNWKW